MQKSRGGVKLQPDHKLVFKADWDLPEKRAEGRARAGTQLAEIAEPGQEGGLAIG